MAVVWFQRNGHDGEVDVGREPEKADRYVDVAAEEEVVHGEGRIVFVGIKRLALFRVEEEVYCITNSCPHAGGFLGMGPVKGCKVQCPRHQWSFDLQTGACDTDPRYTVRRYEVRRESGRILVGVPEGFGS